MSCLCNQAMQTSKNKSCEREREGALTALTTALPLLRKLLPW